jgi:hypothetical protein
MSFINNGIFTFFLILIKYSGEPLKRYGCVKMESAFAPPDIIESAICKGSEICLMLPSAGDENFISVISEA